MKNTYTYKGFTINRTETTTQRPQSKIARLFEIEGLKPVGQLPFIVTLQEAKDYINKQSEEIVELTEEELHSEIYY